MLGFLQGLAYGLFVTCLPWFLIGMVNPRLALAEPHPNRLQVIIRYWLLVPFVAFVLWLTSLWGGFGPSLGGWLAGLAAIAVELPLERGFRGWLARRRARRQAARQAAGRRAEQAREAREKGALTLDPAHPPADADDLVLAIADAKRQLMDAAREDIAVQADRLYSRYHHVMAVLGARFSPEELAFQRAHSLVGEVCLGAVDTLNTMATQARGVAEVDSDFVKRRLAREGESLSVAERLALKRRLELVEQTERHLRELSARNESALTALDDAAVALTRVETHRPQASVAADQALAELRRFVDGAGRYSRTP
ncbi:MULTISPECIES: cobyrinic acid a,c-diamide synthase [Modicisalibacter]|uniref:cobyrinic acid a,c-diamide synthase n=1 Tax=Modicisalibacter TaxID=574347 RepID=UPI00100BE31E|nr:MULTISPECIES: cobyrinic acid a,c-diamide synthase [Halomonadaceae]MBZ9559410.1 cobyrinic acid a,c-diamide synthase [Modicisalibacter sp. R2A 31.J]MBZ9576424.1 cobyrinic acid a,c-diamide synthase [Modicisalibacter sp. MOD 31.J]